MRLTPTELDRLTILTAAELARRRAKYLTRYGSITKPKFPGGTSD
jgi:urease gamma subunit